MLLPSLEPLPSQVGFRLPLCKIKGWLKCFVLFCFPEIKEQSSLPKMVQTITEGSKIAVCSSPHPPSTQTYRSKLSASDLHRDKLKSKYISAQVYFLLGKLSWQVSRRNILERHLTFPAPRLDLGPAGRELHPFGTSTLFHPCLELHGSHPPRSCSHFFH